MLRRIDPRILKWICMPKMFIQGSEKIILETEPYTDLNPSGGSAEAIQLYLSPHGSFCFSARVDFKFHNRFDQCGLILYEGTERKAIVGAMHRDSEFMDLQCVVVHNGKGDRSIRNIGSNMKTLYYRIWYRSKAVRVQYSFTGRRWSDLREFWLDSEEDQLSIGIYACSPGNSWFDCTFSSMTLDEEQGEENV